VEVVGVAAEDNWNRDCGPIFLVSRDGKQQATAVFKFNAWGEKYSPYDGCQQLGDEISALANTNAFHSDMVLEGGAFFVDGQGTLLTTESCLLNKNRNPHMSRREIEQELVRMLGVKKIIWLPGNPLEVETNGHVDGIASFCAPGKILFNAAPQDSGEYYRIIEENRRALTLATDVNGRHFDMIDIPTPSVKEKISLERDCDIYSNYILVNGAVISVAFNVPEDDIVRDIFARAYPGRKLELLPVRHIGVGGGSIHCSTQQQPMQGNHLPHFN
jgi:agmatine deiminase